MRAKRKIFVSIIDFKKKCFTYFFAFYYLK
nr:MAG TPA: hypothetical protein [Caudoviricetes sp.]